MAELIEIVASWRSLLLVLVVFGFAPGFVLRLLVRIYPKDDPRRTELLADLYMLGRVERLMFVAEQLETVLFEGLPHRIREIVDSLKTSKSEQDAPESERPETGEQSDHRPWHLPAALADPSNPFRPRDPLRRRWHNAGLRIGESHRVHAVRFAVKLDGRERVSPACYADDRGDESGQPHPVHNEPISCRNCLTSTTAVADGQPYNPARNQYLLDLPGLPAPPSWPPAAPGDDSSSDP